MQGDVHPTGNFNLTYDQDVNNTLRFNAATTAKMVPDTWQEIKPI